jgi:hypothetical protein
MMLIFKKLFVWFSLLIVYYSNTQNTQIVTKEFIKKYNELTLKTSNPTFAQVAGCSFWVTDNQQFQLDNFDPILAKIRTNIEENLTARENGITELKNNPPKKEGGMSNDELIELSQSIKQKDLNKLKAISKFCTIPLYQKKDSKQIYVSVHDKYHKRTHFDDSIKEICRTWFINCLNDENDKKRHRNRQTDTLKKEEKFIPFLANLIYEKQMNPDIESIFIDFDFLYLITTNPCARKVLSDFGFIVKPQFYWRIIYFIAYYRKSCCIIGSFLFLSCIALLFKKALF